jgi:hypothetical protein
MAARGGFSNRSLMMELQVDPESLRPNGPSKVARIFLDKHYLHEQNWFWKVYLERENGTVWLVNEFAPESRDAALECAKAEAAEHACEAFELGLSGFTKL